MNKIIKYLIVTILCLTIPICVAENELFDGETVFVDDTDFKITAHPHTLYESGYVEFTILSRDYSGEIDLLWGFNKATAKIEAVQSENTSLKSKQKDKDKNKDKREKVTYERIKEKPTLTNKVFDKKHLWYDYPERIIKNNELKIRCWINVSFDSKGKYDFVIKPSHLSLEEAKANNQLWVLDPWYDNSFYYRRPINIDNTGSYGVKNYQINLNLSYQTGMQSDFDDIRFLQDNILIPYWVENKSDSTWCDVWINVSEIDPYQWNNDTVEMYWGNPTVSSLSNNQTTFFQSYLYSGSSIELEKILPSVFVLEGQICQDNTASLDIFGVSNSPAFFTDDSAYVKLNNGMVFTAEQYNEGSITSVLASGAYSPTAVYKIEKSSTDVKYYINDVLKVTSATNVPDESMGIKYDRLTGYMNWSFARFYLDTPPISYLGTNETLFLQYDSNNIVTNSVYKNCTIYCDGGTDTQWTACTLSGSPSISYIEISSYSSITGTGDFEILAGDGGVIDWITVNQATPGTMVTLLKGEEMIETGIIQSNGEFTFNTDLIAGTYSIEVKDYGTITGVHGFIYQGSTNPFPLKDVSIYIYNSSWSDTTFSDSGGYYAFTNLTNTTYILSFKKDRYEEVLYQYVTPTNLSMYRKDIYMQEKSGDFYSRHYVTFILRNTFGVRYSDVDAIVYNNGNVEDTGTSGYDGGVVFHLFEDQEYRVTFINTTQSINEEITLYPRDSSYVIYVGTFSFAPSKDSFYEDVQWYYVKNSINLTHSWLNFSYYDVDNKTTFIQYWVNDSNITSPTTLFYTSQAYPCSTGIYHSNNTVNASNHTYLVHFSAIHPDYPCLAHSGLQSISFYTKKLIDLLFVEQWQYTVTSLCILIFMGMLFGATNAAKGSLLIILTAWFFSFIQWLPSSIPGYASLVLATLLAIGWNLRKNEVVHV